MNRNVPPPPTTQKKTTDSKTVPNKDEDSYYVILHNRVPKVEVNFWIIKVLSTTVGETFADFFNETVGLGLAKTTYLFLPFLAAAVAGQFYTGRYNAFLHWSVVVLMSIVGTLVTDNLTDNLNVKTWISSIVFAILLAITFGGWYYKERSLDIHLISTRPREAFYLVAILFTFSLGTAFGDFITEGLGLGYG